MVTIEEQPVERIIRKQILQESKEYSQVKAEFDTMKKVVEEVLENSKISRNHDNWLIAKVWQRTGWATIADEGLKINIKINEIHKLPSPETITRVRRSIQNDNLRELDKRYLPTSPEVLIKRKIREEVIKAYFGENSTEYNQWKDRKYEIE